MERKSQLLVLAAEGSDEAKADLWKEYGIDWT